MERKEEIADVSAVLDDGEDAGFCEICGEHFHPGDELGEFATPDSELQKSSSYNVIAHVQCGLDKGYAIA